MRMALSAWPCRHGHIPVFLSDRKSATDPATYQPSLSELLPNSASYTVSTFSIAVFVDRHPFHFREVISTMGSEDAPTDQMGNIAEARPAVTPVNNTIPQEATPQDSAPPQTTDSTTEKGLQGRVRWMTSKREFRARAHSNPLNDGLFNPPHHPDELPMDKFFVSAPTDRVVWCDIGCGYGGLLASLSAAFPNKTMLGLEIRDRVAEFCRRRVLEMRTDYAGEYGNVFFERTNAMKFLPNYFNKGSLEKMFFCYPDPHFKKKKNRQRIISSQLLDEYAYVLREGDGIAYIVTDVDELFDWMVERFEKHALFERRCQQEHEADIVSKFVRDMTDEAQRVEKSDRRKQDASFRRKVNP